MLLFFVVALASTIVRGLSIDCGCFKAAEAATGSAWRALLWDILYLVASAQMLFSRSCRWQLSRNR
jgi:hypothetical protein